MMIKRRWFFASLSFSYHHCKRIEMLQYLIACVFLIEIRSIFMNNLNIDENSLAVNPLMTARFPKIDKFKKKLSKSKT